MQLFILWEYYTPVPEKIIGVKWVASDASVRESTG
jgi:hypothetical protein